MTSHAVLGLLSERLPAGVEAAALAAARAAPSSALADWAEAAAALADDAGLEPGLRCAALLCVALLCQRGAAVPVAALGALGDDVLLDAALADGMSAAITGIAAAAGDLLAPEDRRYLAQRLSVAGAIGEHVAALHLAAGDPLAAAKALARGLEAVLADHAPGADEAVAVAHLAVVWSDAWGPSFTDALVAAVTPAARPGVSAAVRAAGAGELHPLVRSLAR